MQAVVLAGGRGARLYPLTNRVPKPLVPVLGRPLLGYLLDHLQSRGIDEVFVTAGHLGGRIAEFVAAEARPIPVHVVREPSVRGTAGAVADLLPRLRGPFVVVSGDAVIDLALDPLLAGHRSAMAVATICTAPPVDRLRFGVIAASGPRIEGFVEKPSLGHLLPSLVVSTGCYILERAALAGVPAQGSVDFASDVFPALLRAGAPLGVTAALRYWRDIGTPEAYRDIHMEALSETWPWGIPARQAPARLEHDVEFSGTVGMGSGVRIGAGARLIGPLYLGDGVTVGRHSTVARSVLLAGSRVGAHAEVRDAVVDADAQVGAGVVVSGALISRAAPHPEASRHPVSA